MELSKLRTLARENLDKHGLHDWSFKINKNKRRLGVCRHAKKRIEIQGYYALNNPDHLVLDTLIHEIAHAIVGPGHGHGPVWKAKARDLGCIPKSCAKITQSQEGNWQAVCPGCQKTFHLYRTPKHITGSWCGKCGRFKGKLTFVWKGDGPQPPPRKVRTSTRRWKAVCPGCANIFVYKRKPKYVTGMNCRKCGRLKGQLIFRLASL